MVDHTIGVALKAESDIPVINMVNQGNMGNRMFQYAFCRILQDLVPGSIFTGFNIPEFSLTSENAIARGRSLHIEGGHQHSLLSLAYKLNSGIYNHLNFAGFAQRLEYYHDYRHHISGMFQSDANASEFFFGEDVIIINVRANDTLRATHPDYAPVPISFFQQVVESSGLNPVIVGQLGDNPYSHEIRRRFGDIHVVPSTSALQDFEIVRNAAHVVMGVSTFSWMACWLSVKAKTIHLPISGIFNPRQRPDIDLLPCCDSRYCFYEFPVSRWEATSDQLANLLGNGQRFPNINRSEIKARIP